jgi:hypothetical protein
MNLANIAAATIEYDLTVIQDDSQTPLAGAIPGIAGQDIFKTMLIVLITAACACLVIMYIHTCRKYRKRIKELAGRYRDTEIKDPGWNLTELRKQISDLECDISEQMIKTEATCSIRREA